MTKSGKGRGKPPEPEPKPEVSGRAQAVFERTRHFDKELEKLGPVNTARVAAAVQQFQREWLASKTDEDISPGFDFKQLSVSAGQYRLCQIEATGGYRATVTFLVRRGQAYWLHVWKKSAMNNRTDIELSKQRAKDLWGDIQGKGKRVEKAKGKGGKA